MIKEDYVYFDLNGIMVEGIFKRNYKSKCLVLVEHRINKKGRMTISKDKLFTSKIDYLDSKIKEIDNKLKGDK